MKNLRKIKVDQSSVEIWEDDHGNTKIRGISTPGGKLSAKEVREITRKQRAVYKELQAKKRKKAMTKRTKKQIHRAESTRGELHPTSLKEAVARIRKLETENVRHADQEHQRIRDVEDRAELDDAAERHEGTEDQLVDHLPGRVLAEQVGPALEPVV